MEILPYWAGSLLNLWTMSGFHCQHTKTGNVVWSFLVHLVCHLLYAFILEEKPCDQWWYWHWIKLFDRTGVPPGVIMKHFQWWSNIINAGFLLLITHLRYFLVVLVNTKAGINPWTGFFSFRNSGRFITVNDITIIFDFSPWSVWQNHALLYVNGSSRAEHLLRWYLITKFSDWAATVTPGESRTAFHNAISGSCCRKISGYWIQRLSFQPPTRWKARNNEDDRCWCQVWSLLRIWRMFS